MTVLIVEDTISHSLDLEIALIDLGIEDIHKVTNLSDAKNLIESTEIHIAFVDLHLREEKGGDILPALKKHGVYSIIVTGFPTLKNIQETVNYNVDGFIKKPISTEEIQFHVMNSKNVLNTRSSNNLVLEINNKLINLKSIDLHYIETEGNYTTIFLKHGKEVVKRSLKKVVGDIQCNDLIQVYRNVVINRSHITRVDFSTNKIQTSFGKVFILGRSFKPDIKNIFLA